MKINTRRSSLLAQRTAEAQQWREAAESAAWLLREIIEGLRPTEGGEPMSLTDALEWTASRLERGDVIAHPVRITCDSCEVVGVSLGARPSRDEQRRARASLKLDGWQMGDTDLCPTCRGGRE